MTVRNCGRESFGCVYVEKWVNIYLLGANRVTDCGMRDRGCVEKEAGRGNGC